MLPAPPLLLVTDRRQARGGLGDIAEAALAAGCRWISLREKDLPPDEQVALLRDIEARAASWRATVTLHGDPELARRGGAHGVHLPDGAHAPAARESLGAKALIGVSVHGVAGAASVDPRLVDYLVAGPVFATASKPGYGPALRPDGVAAIVAAARVPVIAIGGVDAGNAAECLRAGAAGVAVMGGIMRAEDPGREMRRLIEAVQPRGR